MSTPIDVDDELLARASEVSGITEKAQVVGLALKTLIAHQAARQLAQLGGSDPDAWIPSRRRFPE